MATSQIFKNSFSFVIFIPTFVNLSDFIDRHLIVYQTLYSLYIDFVTKLY